MSRVQDFFQVGGVVCRWLTGCTTADIGGGLSCKRSMLTCEWGGNCKFVNRSESVLEKNCHLGRKFFRKNVEHFPGILPPRVTDDNYFDGLAQGKIQA